MFSGTSAVRHCFFVFFLKDPIVLTWADFNTNHTFTIRDPTRALLSGAQHRRIANASVNGRRGASDERGRADSGAPLNTDERKASWILIRLPPLFSSVLCVSPSIRVKILQRRAPFWTGGDVIRSAFQSQGPGPPLKDYSICLFWKL